MRIFHFEILFIDGSHGNILAEENYEKELKGKEIDLISIEMIFDKEDLYRYIRSLK